MVRHCKGLFAFRTDEAFATDAMHRFGELVGQVRRGNERKILPDQAKDILNFVQPSLYGEALTINSNSDSLRYKICPSLCQKGLS